MDIWINTECEFKAIGDDAQLSCAESFLTAKFPSCSGLREYQRDHHYFDTSSRKLLKTRASFRKSVGAFYYCLKYAVPNAPWTRRESFHRDQSALDLSNQFHRQLPILRRLLLILGNEELETFSAGVRVRTLRRTRQLYQNDGIDKLVNVSFDRSFAVSIRNPAVAIGWCEMEVETNGAFSSSHTTVEDIGRSICAASGLTESSLSKYERALGLQSATVT